MNPNTSPLTANVVHRNREGLDVRLLETLDPVNDGVKVYPPVSINTRITTATTTVVLATPCWVRIKIQNGVMGAVTVYNNTAASGTVLFTGTPAAKDIIFGEWTYCSIGCTIVTAAATEVFVETI